MEGVRGGDGVGGEGAEGEACYGFDSVWAEEVETGAWSRGGELSEEGEGGGSTTVVGVDFEEVVGVGTGERRDGVDGEGERVEAVEELGVGGIGIVVGGEVGFKEAAEFDGLSEGEVA